MGARLRFCTPESPDDYEHVGLDYIFQRADETRAVTDALGADDDSVVSFLIASGTVAGFFEQNDQLFVRFLHPIQTPLGTEITTWELSKETLLLFEP